MTTIRRLTIGRIGGLAITVLVGIISGLWVGYILIYPYATLPVPQHTLGIVLLLGIYIDRFAETMLDRIVMLFSAAVIAFIIGAFVFSLPALLGLFGNPIVQQTVYINGLRRALIYTLPVVVLLLAGTFTAYLFRNILAELTR
ncbi:MAG: hypothetical protein ABEH65_04765 [Halobacteriales archaeon]